MTLATQQWACSLVKATVLPMTLKHMLRGESYKLLPNINILD